MSNSTKDSTTLEDYIMRYKEYRLAKRNGEIIQQERHVYVNKKSKWLFFDDTEVNKGEWKDIEIPVIDEKPCV
jgi:hypothetical protein